MVQVSFKVFTSGPCIIRRYYLGSNHLENVSVPEQYVTKPSPTEISLQMTQGVRNCSPGDMCLSMKFYYNIATLNCLLILCGCVSAVTTELSSCDRSHMTHKA